MRYRSAPKCGSCRHAIRSRISSSRTRLHRWREAIWRACAATPMSRTVERHTTDSRAPILLTMGEPAGIGPEIAVAAFNRLDGRIGTRPLKLVGDPDVFRAWGPIADASLVATQPLLATCAPGKGDPA